MEIITQTDERKIGTLTLVVYILQAVSLFVGVTALVGVIINYLKRSEAAGTVYASHFSWQIRTFWWAVAGSVVGGVLMVIGVGFLIWAAVYVWYIYRIVRGYLNYNDGKPMPV
ncbi:Uncharacterized membrane protein [Gulbenkiania indica]|uniref:Uncharacterized membrane protein n=1 Tax=Gulbenkiania indica TaxID=375574 RepID=A0A0K6H3J2_9NEIS|nr:hypothetical protein [Gulbenkiania indica]CUA85299.1 Uncharacterized membrane protein [Gulbenkiania indica]